MGQTHVTEWAKIRASNGSYQNNTGVWEVESISAKNGQKFTGNKRKIRGEGRAQLVLTV